MWIYRHGRAQLLGKRPLGDHGHDNDYDYERGEDSSFSCIASGCFLHFHFERSDSHERRRRKRRVFVLHRRSREGKVLFHSNFVSCLHFCIQGVLHCTRKGLGWFCMVALSGFRQWLRREDCISVTLVQYYFGRLCLVWITSLPLRFLLLCSL